MNDRTLEEMKNLTIDILISPDGSVKLDYFETFPVERSGSAGETVPALIWYHEEEQQFIVELSQTKELQYRQYRSVDELLGDGWVCCAQVL